MGYYVKTFASSSFYGRISRTKHEKNKILLKVAAVSTLMIGLFVGIGNESYFEQIKYAKRWFLSFDKYSIESYEAKKNVQRETLGGFENDQVEGSNFVSNEENVIERRVINGEYQKESEVMLSSKYFHQRAHDLFEFVT